MQAQILKKPESFYDDFFRKPGANPQTTHYCPGCGHGVIHKLIAEAIDDFGVRERAIFVSPVGCSVFGYYYFNCGNVQVAHGRAPAVATGIKRALPDSLVVCYQGDGDLAAIGGNNILQAANRGENISVIFVNNAIYGMTGSQMAPTTLIGQKTTTTPLGRTAQNEGYPLRMCELLATLEAPIYIERVAISDTRNVMRARKAIRTALHNQIEGRGFSFVEVLSACPTGWKMTPIEAKHWVQDVLAGYFVPGKLREEKGSSGLDTGSPESNGRSHPILSNDEIYELLAAAKSDSATCDQTRPERTYREPRIKIAGFGGQGILLLGQLISISAMRSGYHTTWLPSYGPEMRGGTANCHVIISEKRVGSPLVTQSDVLIAMNLPSLDKFEKDLRSGGLAMINETLVPRKISREDLIPVYVPATALADRMGNTRVANVVMLGAYAGYTGVLSTESIQAALAGIFIKPQLFKLNKEAFEVGLDFAQKLRAQ